MKSGIVSIVGRTNVGKSTLMNRLLDEKVSIVSPVVQTTRNVIRGILNDERGQIALLDTPGVHRAQNDLGKIMNQSARQTVRGADAVLLVLDVAEKPWQEDDGWLRRLAREATALTIALNKSDLAEDYRAAYEALWRKAVEEHARQVPAVWVALSALTGAGVDLLTAAVFDMLPEGPPLFPEDMLTDFPRKLAMADLIREKLLALLHDELPHAIAVNIEHLDDSGEPWEMDAVIYVNRHSQKGIVIGHKGRLVRKAQRQAEAELTALYEKKIRLRLRVKVQEHWVKNHWILKQLGYV